jgi:predicted secreted protein with PEFG-CTERM motif
MNVSKKNKKTLAALSVSLLVSGILSLSVSGIASAQAITVETDQSSYETGDTLMISGNVGTPQGTQPALIRVIDPKGVLVRADQADVAADGSYTYTFPAGGLMRNSGEHTVQVTYGTSTEETTFDFTATEQSVGVWQTFTLEIAGVEYPIRYQIIGGAVEDMVADPATRTLLVTLDSSADGMLTIELPRVVMDAEEDDFSVFMDGEIGHFVVDELEPTDQARTVSIEFVQGAQEIEIVGTFMVPEFGTIAAIVLALAVIGVIVASSRYRMLGFRSL